MPQEAQTDKTEGSARQKHEYGPLSPRETGKIRDALCLV
jgi:hypothetical protein